MNQFILLHLSGNQGDPLLVNIGQISAIRPHRNYTAPFDVAGSEVFFATADGEGVISSYVVSDRFEDIRAVIGSMANIVVPPRPKNMEVTA